MTASPNHLITAITASLEAGKAILEIYHSGEFDIELKGDNSPLTKADTASHDVIMSYLEATNIPVLSEEGRDIPYQERKAWKQLWIVDPIVGTKEFIKRIDHLYQDPQDPNPKYFRPTEVYLLIGDASKAKTKLGWEPHIQLNELVDDMMSSDISLFKKDTFLIDNGYKTLNYFE